MPGQDREKQERLLNLAGWLHHKHRFETLPHGGAFTEVRFSRETLSHVPALAAYSLEAGAAGERALIRDVADLKQFGIEVRWEPATQQWVSLAAPLTEEECRALATAALYVLVEDGSHMETGYHVPGAGLTVAGAELIVAYASIVDVLVEAIRTRTPVTFVHRGIERIVDPWHVFMADGRWYLVGLDHEADERRAFSLVAVEAVDLIGAPGSFDIPREDWEGLTQTISNPDEWTDHDPVEVTLEVDQRLVARAEQILGAIRTRDEPRSGWVEMQCQVRNVDAFVTRLWGIRARAVVVEPAEVRSAVVEALEGMA